MSHFYGTVQGQAGQATRRGSKNSGLTTVAASWEGAIKTTMFVDAKGNNVARIELTPWHGRGIYKHIGDFTISTGKKKR